MLFFLDLSHEEVWKKGRLNNITELKQAIVHSVVKRIRPKIMTVASARMGLMPIMWAMGAGSGIMKRISAIVVGGAFHFILA
jgi:Cu(I)/Ag(I) efflux system membrane protein CusA/SilA